MSKEFEKLEFNVLNTVRAIQHEVTEKTGLMTRKVNNLEKQTKGLDKMLDDFKEISEFVNNTRKKAAELEQEQSQLGTTIKRVQEDLEQKLSADSEATNVQIQKVQAELLINVEGMRSDMKEISSNLEKFIKVHNEKHENDKGILKKIFG